MFEGREGQPAYQPNPAIFPFLELLAVVDGQPSQFNGKLNEYKLAIRSFPEVKETAGKADFEAWYNGFNPTSISRWLYLLAIVLSFISFLAWRSGLNQFVSWLLLGTLILHTFAIGARIWLTGRKSKAAYVLDDNGFRIGSEVKVKLEKSRFGTQGRTCTFRILWGTDPIGVQDAESWFEALKGFMSVSGSWYTLEYNGYTKRFQPSKWVGLLKSDPEFKKHVIDFMDEVVVQKFEKREGEASDFYEVDKAS